MLIKETFADKAAEGKSKVLELGVYILETLGAVGLPAEQVAAALLSFRPKLAQPKKEQKQASKRKRRRKLIKNRDNVLVRQEENPARRNASSHVHKNNDLFHRAVRFVIEAGTSSPQQVISRILFYLADALGESLDKPSKRDLERAVGAFVEEAHCQRGSRVKLERIPQPLCRAVTGVVLSYQERDDLTLPSHTLNKIRRGMHFHIPIRPFDATVQLLPPPNRKNRGSGPQLRLTDGLVHDEYDEEEDKVFQQDVEEQDFMGRAMAHSRAVNRLQPSGSVMMRVNYSECVVPCTPQSFPPTPESRTQLLGDYSEFTENVLWRARDELRGEQEDDDRPRMAIFNPEDAHPKILLSCGGHCASLEQRNRRSAMPQDPVQGQQHLQRIYRSVRSALTFQYGRTTYFEICPVWSGPSNSDIQLTPLHLCVGVSTKAMSLRNTVAGCSPKTVGLDSSGVLLFSGRRTRTTGFTYGSVIGVCVRSWISHLLVGFFVDGVAVHCDTHDLGVNVCDSDTEEFKDTTSAFTVRHDGGAPAQYFPTVSIKSNNVKVFGHFSAADMRHPESDSAFWNPVRGFVPGEPIYALDGTRLLSVEPQDSN